MTFPNSKIELHQWANTILLGVVGFFVVQTYLTIQADHETLGKHETEIALSKQYDKQQDLSIGYLTGQVETIRKYRR